MNKLEKIGKSIAKKQTSNPIKFMIILMILILITAPGIFLLLSHVEPSLEKTLPQNVQEVKTMNDMRTQFGADMMYIVVNSDSVTDLRNPQVIKFIDLISQKIEKNDFILDVYSIANIVKESTGKIPDSIHEIKTILKNNPLTKMYLNYDYSLALIQIRSDTGSSSKIINRVVKDIKDDIKNLETFNPGVTTSITGFNAIDKATFEVIIRDFMYITVFSLLFMVIFLFIYFRSIKKIVMSTSVIILSLIMTLGITGYLGITITVISMVAAAMIMALGISYGINVTYEYYILKKSHSKKESIKKLNSLIIRALTGSSFTTGAGFLALLFGVIPAMKNLGIILAMGIIITLLNSVLFLPVIIYLLDRRSK